MCDQTEVSYLEDDVVWVKIGPIWWPGVVKDLEKTDEGKEILASLKKKPIAVVKFFQEDNFEFVKNLEHIYHYSCRRKDEFIKKGLDKFRTGAPHMKKFPADVTTAESLTNGDVNIINDPKFFPEKKESYSEIFGSGKKKSKKDSELSSRQRVKQASVTPYRPITHQRFINKALHGESDHKVKTLIQCNSSSDDGATGKPYKCHICKFETSRVNVIVAHHRLSHSNKNSISWTGSDSRSVRKKPIYKSRKVKSKKLFESFKEDESEEEVIEKSKSHKSKNFKEKSKSEPSTPASKRKGRDSALDVSDSKKPRYTDVLLADWNEDEEDDKRDSGSEDKEKNDGEEEKESKDESVAESSEQTENSDPCRTRKNQNEKMSCFDFDEEEEGFIGMSNANTYGRKIPRVIPVKDKPELGMDLEIEELFKKKNESELESSQEEGSKKDETREDGKTTSGVVSGEAKEKEDNENPTPVKGPGRRRRSKASKEEELKASSEDSLAMRRTRRPGAKKSYLNEVIEKVVDEDVPPDNEKKVPEINKTEIKVQTREEGGSSSRRKQDLKQTMDSVKKNYPEVLSEEQNAKSELEKKNKGHSKDSRRRASDDLTAEIDSLLEETKVPSLPEKADKAEENKQTNFSFDYVPSEGVGKKVSKTSKEVKSISRMFSDCLPVMENVSELDVVVPQETVEVEEGKDSTEEKTGEVSQGKNLKFPPETQKRGSIVLSSGKDCIVLSRSKILKPAEETEQNSTETETNRPKNIKAIKVKSDSLPPLIAAGKLKGQTIIHQKGGKYVIVTQSPPLARQKASRGKVQSGSKVVILRNQLGEQKIMTTSGLQQAKFKVDGQKITASSEVVTDKEASTSDPSAAVGQAQPVIKMVPDGKGGIMKQLTVSPKKVILGSTKVLVSASGSTFSTGNNVQKITLSGGGGVGRAAGGDFRLIENYKGNGKAVLIHSGLNEGSGILKTTTGVPRQVTKVIKRPQAIPALKKKPKILLRAATSQDEYVIEQESPTFFVKQDTSTQKFVNQPKATDTGKKTFFISGQAANKKGESYILTSDEAVSGKVIRMRQKIKEIEVPGQKVQRTIQKSPEAFTLSQGKIEDRRTIQIQEKTQKPALRTQVIAMPTPLGAGGNQTYVLVSVNENDPTQDLSNSIVGYGTTGQGEPIFVNPTSTGNLILINPKTTKEVTPVYSTSSQDILAKALANTNVLEGAMGNEMDSVVPSILLPPSIPSSVVQETSITLQKPIMTPLEMPTSVAPDTSGLEPPPLPPTPTEEDVLMEETETTATQVQVQEQSEEETSSTNAIQTYLKQETFDHLKPAEPSFQDGEDPGDCDGKLTEDYSSVEMNKKVAVKLQHLPHEEFTIENSQEQTNTFQSLPVLNDEPDTSERGVVLIGEEQFEVEKSVADSKQFSQLLRGQEPSSSTNKESKKFEGYLQSEESVNYENYPKNNESEERLEVEMQKAKESAGESHSMPVIEEENNANSFEIDPIYSGEISQKRFEEETEVSSTTDEFSNKTIKH